MIFYYTGSNKFGLPQGSIDKSLGGFISGTTVPNSMLGNLFSEISLLTEERQLTETKAIALKNSSGSAAVNLYMWFEYPNDGNVVYNLDTNEADLYFSITGLLGEIVKLVIPNTGTSSPFTSLYTRVNAGGVDGGDKFVVSLKDASITVNNVILHVKSSYIDGTDAVIEFLAPDYTALGLDFNTTQLDTVLSTYPFTSYDRINKGKIEIAPVVPSNLGLDGYKMEQIGSIRALPYTGTFFHCNGEGNKILLSSSFANDSYLGFWFKRSIEEVSEINTIDKTQLEAYINSMPKREDIVVKLAWT